MRKIYLLSFGLFTAMALNAQTWDGTASAWTNGDGTESNPYVIESPQNLAYLSEQVRNGETFKDKYFILAKDLDMGKSENHKFSPIGFFDEYIDTENDNTLVDDSKYFLGNFNGNYRTIDNINVYYSDTSNEVGGTGLFACISDGAVIKNLTIGENSLIEGYFATGAIVGAMTGGTVENCLNNAEFNIAEGGSMGVGGIVGSLCKGTVSECANLNDIKAGNNVGGIAGFVDKGGIVENCYNGGSITLTGFYAGGIIGYLSKGECKNSYNYGNVSSDLFCQAVVGTTDNGVTIENCYYMTIDGAATDENEGVTAKTEEEMKAEAFVSDLDKGQDVWSTDTKNLNNGLPILKWQIEGVSNIETAKENTTNVYSNGNYIYVISENNPHVTVTDMSGCTIYNKTTNQPIYISDTGLYLVTVYNSTGNETFKVYVR